ncbi:uncharacterized protein MONBRDRAFT_33013 [Monosiga brevicollis MX1]|uniref:GST N-terminal domain-containing protein n=1 Tax=Monosiga brevicollis TaxID=81824 RepID=A9V307_MONBE|nr:uncharacterized protein MONBRDRAFT_33013 [Monosiga brevicollis MX1]EDQ87979.1 predicted protein [Monosiga brevicollis MX1]|eukprot:XP_001747055.1 hypothetical protein [Monosiga brevicollis MX1]
MAAGQVVLLTLAAWITYWIGLYQRALQWICSRLGVGSTMAGGTPLSPQEPLILYEYEGCPYCLRVREAISVLNLDVIIYPCPRETLRQNNFCRDSRFRAVVERKAGQIQFPFLIDPNSNGQAAQGMLDSTAIIEYLWTTYGADASPPLNYRLVHAKVLQAFFGMLDIASRLIWRALPQNGLLRAPSRQPTQMLELWGREGSPYVQLVREALCTLELPYRYVTVPFGAEEKRATYRAMFGRHLPEWRKKANLVMIPLLLDPNTGAELVESREILSYLRKTYQVGDPPRETVADLRIPTSKSKHN